MKLYRPFTRNRSLRNFLTHTHISIKNRYVYFAVAKAANSTVKYYLQRVEYLGTPYKVTKIYNKHYSPLLSPNQLDEEDCWAALFGTNFTRFTLVRNPYSRLLSCFLDRLQDSESASYRNARVWSGKDPEGLTFREFVEMISEQTPKEMDCHSRPQVYETYHDILRMDCVLKFEDLP